MLSNVAAGEHRLAVALIGADGAELARSAPVTVAVKPPAAAAAQADPPASAAR
jgi:hypothetical protein